jgi:GABA permease
VRRILVVANETLGAAALFREIRARSDGYREQVLVLCPALNSALRHWLSDEDGARAAAGRRLDASLGRLAAAGIDAHGAIGDADPLQAIEDALRIFGADEIIISTHPPERSNWLERGVVAKARARFTVPVTHVIGEQAEAETAPAIGVTSPA